MSTPDLPAGPPQVPVCYRHPDRETYIRCTRCERPICPDCMTSAAVGFQCPECVAEGAASVRPTRTALGARTITRPYVTLTLLTANVVLFGVQTLLGDAFTDQYAVNYVDIAAHNEFYRLITGTFLHAGLWHVAMNMLGLWFLGPQLETLLGHVRFTTLYLVSALGGSVASFWLTTPYTINGGYYFPATGVGASGAIFGLLGAYLVVGRRLGADLRAVWILLAINLGYGFLVPGIDWRAHLGGAITGALVAGIFAFAPQRNRVLVQMIGVAVVVAALVALVLVRDAVLTQQIIDDGLNV